MRSRHRKLSLPPDRTIFWFDCDEYISSTVGSNGNEMRFHWIRTRTRAPDANSGTVSDAAAYETGGPAVTSVRRAMPHRPRA